MGKMRANDKAAGKGETWNRKGKKTNYSNKKDWGERPQYRRRRENKSEENVKELASLDYVYGVNAVKEAINGERTVNSILLSKGKSSPSIREIVVSAKQNKILVKEVAPEKLKSLVGTDRHQGIVAYMSPMPYYDLDKLVLDHENSRVVVALDEITDVHNLGAVMRTVDACGLRYVMIPERRSAQLNTTVSKTSAGALEYVRMVKVSSLGKSLETLKKEGYWIIGADMDGETDYRNADYSGKVVIVIGSENKGLRPHIQKLCDFRVSIPMRGRINSLNASVSASILLYEAMRSEFC